MKRFLVWSLLIILTILLFLWIALKINRNVETQKRLASVQISKTQPVEIFTTFKTSMEKDLNLVGSIKPGVEVNVFSKVPGKLKKKLVQVGDKVKKEEVLAILERDEIGLTFEDAPIISPIFGQVNKIFLDIGSRIGTDAPLMNLINLDTVKIIMHIAEEDLGFIKERMLAKIKVDAYPDKSFSGKISRINPTLDPVTHKIEIEIEIFNPQNLLKPGMFAQINLLLAKHTNIIKIPYQAIILKQGEPFVFIMENGLARMKKIELGLRDNDYAEVTKGLSEGEEVITLGNQDLKDNDSVKVVGEGK